MILAYYRKYTKYQLIEKIPDNDMPEVIPYTLSDMDDTEISSLIKKLKNAADFFKIYCGYEEVAICKGSFTPRLFDYSLVIDDIEDDTYLGDEFIIIVEDGGYVILAKEEE